MNMNYWTSMSSGARGNPSGNTGTLSENAGGGGQSGSSSDPRINTGGMYPMFVVQPVHEINIDLPSTSSGARGNPGGNRSTQSENAGGANIGKNRSRGHLAVNRGNPSLNIYGLSPGRFGGIQRIPSSGQVINRGIINPQHCMIHGCPARMEGLPNNSGYGIPGSLGITGNLVGHGGLTDNRDQKLFCPVCCKHKHWLYFAKRQGKCEDCLCFDIKTEECRRYAIDNGIAQYCDLCRAFVHNQNEYAHRFWNILCNRCGFYGHHDVNCRM